MQKYFHSTTHIPCKPVPGIWVSSQNILPPTDADESNSQIPLQMLQPKPFSPNNDNYCVIPTMPALPPTILEPSQEVQLQAPLKCRYSPYSNKTSFGFQSGLRSLVIPCKIMHPKQPSEVWIVAEDSRTGEQYIPDSENGDVLIRAKGCGMWLPDQDLPFPAITLAPIYSFHAKEGQELLQIRGVCFPNTSATEIFVNDQIEESLNKIGLMSANHSIGFWLYKDLQNDVSPLIQKSVTLFKTLGDRRLETHLFAGLEKLIPKKFTEKLCDQVIELILPLYDNNRDLIPQRSNPSYHRVAQVNTRIIKNFVITNHNNLNNVRIEDFNDDEIEKFGIVPSYKIYETLQNLDRNLDIMLKLYGQLGFECGRNLSVIHRTGYLWGTYVDHNPAEQHCNAHNDNLVVLSKDVSLTNSKKLQLLAPLDFDMAFKKENAVNFWTTPAEPDPSYCVDQFFAEFLALLQDVGGYFATLPMSSAIKPREAPPKSLANLLWLLRDVAVYEFIQGYQDVNSDGCKGNTITRDEAYELIEQALDETVNYES